MSARAAYPGVYLEQLPTRVGRIPEVSTSVTAFVGFLKRGPMNRAVRMFSAADLERIFGALDADCEVAYSVREFFLNGGIEAWVVRTAAGSPAAASVILQDDAAIGSRVLKATAALSLQSHCVDNPGTWGNRLRLDVDHDVTGSDQRFNLTVTEMVEQHGELVPGASETYRNLSMDPASAAYARDVVNDASRRIRLDPPTGVTHSETTRRPAQTGTTGGVVLTDALVAGLSPSESVTLLVDGTGMGSFSLGTAVSQVSQLRRTLQSRLRGIAGLEQATVEVVDSRLRIRAGGSGPDAIIEFTDAGGTVANTLGLDAAAGAIANVQSYSLGIGADAGRQVDASAGDDGWPPGPASNAELVGSSLDKTGMFALEDVELFNLLCIPRMAELDVEPAADLITKATAYCEQRRALLIIDTPAGVKNVEQMQDWIDDHAILRHKNAAVYFPRVLIADPLSGLRPTARPASGTLAGLYARTDSVHGPWKAPAGNDAVLRGVSSLQYKLTDAENGSLNAAGVNALRSLRDAGIVSWGARTFDGSDQRGSPWKYIPVRRTALFLEESLYRGTQWVVFEPNGESLWAQIRLNVTAFMQGLFQRGAFRGASPRDAFFVKCDRETTTPDDIARGIVNILVGFAPLKPAEFIIIRIQQVANQEGE